MPSFRSCLLYFLPKKSHAVGIWNPAIWNPDFLKVRFKMVWFTTGGALAIVPTIWKPDHSKSRLSRISDFGFLYLFYFQWPVGLKNVGQTCWFSAVIQSLFYLPAFRSLVLNYRPLDTATSVTSQIDEDSNKRPPTSAFADRQRKIVEFMQVRRHRLITSILDVERRDVGRFTDIN